MNRTILAILLAISAALALAPPASATAGSWTSPPVCSDLGTACAQITVDWRLVFDGESPCVRIGTGDDTAYECTIHWDLSLSLYGTGSCGWAWNEVTGEVTKCVILGVGVGSDSAPGGEKTYLVSPGTRTVPEEFIACIDYPTDVQRCEWFTVLAALPALDGAFLLDNPIPRLIESAHETAHAVVDWALNQIPPI